MAQFRCLCDAFGLAARGQMLFSCRMPLPNTDKQFFLFFVFGFSLALQISL